MIYGNDFGYNFRPSGINRREQDYFATFHLYLAYFVCVINSKLIIRNTDHGSGILVS